jgi:hypothetical protein
MAAAGLPSVFAACPALVSVSIRNTLRPGHLSPLLQLPATVENLEVGGEAWDDAAAGVLGHLTQLRSLFGEGPSNVGSDGWVGGLIDVGLLELTALQGLTRLHIFSTPGLSVHFLMMVKVWKMVGVASCSCAFGQMRWVCLSSLLVLGSY